MYTPQSPSGDGRRPTPAQPQINQQAQNPSNEPGPARSSNRQQTVDVGIDAAPRRRVASTQTWRRDRLEGRHQRKVGKSPPPSAPGEQGPDLPANGGGGEKGLRQRRADLVRVHLVRLGRLYAQSMVAPHPRELVTTSWPDLLRTGMQGVVTIRFTIHRNGQITDVTILDSSGTPAVRFRRPRKAIENSSPLNPLSEGISPMSTERVTAMFYYNMEPPAGR